MIGRIIVQKLHTALQHKSLNTPVMPPHPHTEMELDVFNFYSAGFPMPSQLTRCCDNIVYKVVSNLHQQLQQTTVL